MARLSRVSTPSSARAHTQKYAVFPRFARTKPDALPREIHTKHFHHGLLVHHSDRGSPYGSDDYIKRLDAVGSIRSMSRKCVFRPRPR